MGFLHGTAEIIRERRKQGLPFWFIDHAYFRRGYDKANFRVVRNGIHKCWVSGESRFHVKLSRWHHGDDIIVIPPPPMVEFTYDLQGWVEQTLGELKNHTNRRVIVKKKEDGVLADYLGRAWALVSYASVADVEAVCAGVPVFTSPYSPAAPVGKRDLSLIEVPYLVDREVWAGSLTCGQFHVTEMASGEAWRILNEVD